jgi:putative transposase
VSEYIHKSHNVSVLLYHLVCPAKYRRVVFTEEVDKELRDVCLEIGTDMDHVHFLVQTIPMYSPKKIVQTIKSITAREIFRRVPSVKKALWGGEFWSKGYFINTVGQFGNEKSITEYVKKQGREKEYKKLHSQQLELFGFDTP